MTSPSTGSIQIAVYFADSKLNLYQIRQWFAPLAALAEIWPVAIITRAPTTALALFDESPVPVLHVRSTAELENTLVKHPIKIVFYVNQNSKNFQMFRYGRIWHVFINHGESDKMYMTTNQFKAYDFSLVAGQAARDRLHRSLWNFDVDRRTLMIGRPQADHFGEQRPCESDDRTVVLYAPTWEGDRGAAAYGSVVSHGVTIVDTLLATGAHRVIYRPHPRTGLADVAFKQSNITIIDAINRANLRDPSAGHIYDDAPQLGWQLAAADVAVTDISAMVYDRLATGRPLIITRPLSDHAEIDLAGYLGAAEWLDSSETVNIVSHVERVQTDVQAKLQLDYWVTRHFGDTSPGASTRRFHNAVGELLQRWETENAKASERALALTDGTSVHHTVTVP